MTRLKPLLSSHILYIPPPIHSTYFHWILPNSTKTPKEFVKKWDQIVWIGNKTKSRSEILDRWGDELIWKKDIWKKEDWKEMLENYVFYINLHRIPKCNCLETFRIVPILANGGIVISEEVSEEEMLKWKDFHIYFGKREELYDLWKKIQKEIYPNSSIYYQKWQHIYSHPHPFINPFL